MAKDRIFTKDNLNLVDVEYDDNVFDIEYHRESDNLVIRYKNGRILQVYKGNMVSFVVQPFNKESLLYNSDEKLIISEYDKKGRERYLRVYHPALDRWLILDNTHLLPDHSLASSRIKNTNTFIVGEWDNYQLYNVDTDKDSEHFRKIIKCGSNSPLGEGAILVSQERVFEHPSTGIELFKDLIYYGINPETFEATTLIWSQLQDKLFPLCGKKEYDASKRENETLTEYTIRTRIDDYLQKMTKKIPNRNYELIEYELIEDELAEKHLSFKPSNKKKKVNE